MMIETTGRPFSRVRHPAWVRLTHWTGAAATLSLMVSGTAILLALPKLFWGETGANDAPAWITLPLPVNLEQTGWARNLHFLSAWIFVLNGAAYLALALLRGHLRRRLLPSRPRSGRGRSRARSGRTCACAPGRHRPAATTRSRSSPTSPSYWCWRR